jgi:hypothetical protein
MAKRIATSENEVVASLAEKKAEETRRRNDIEAQEKRERLMREAYIPDHIRERLADTAAFDETLAPADRVRDAQSVLVNRGHDSLVTERESLWNRADDMAALMGAYEMLGLNRDEALAQFPGDIANNQRMVTVARLTDHEDRLSYEKSFTWHRKLVQLARRSYRSDTVPNGFGPSTVPQTRADWEGLAAHVKSLTRKYTGDSTHDLDADLLKANEAAAAKKGKGPIIETDAHEATEKGGKDYVEHTVKARVDTGKLYLRQADGTKGGKFNPDVIIGQVGVTMGDVDIIIRVPKNAPQPKRYVAVDMFADSPENPDALDAEVDVFNDPDLEAQVHPDEF